MPAKKTTAATPEAEATDAAESLSYEEAREELMLVVRSLEQGGTTLEESLALWERGEKLASTCQTFLDQARTRLDEVVGTDD